MNGWAIAVIVLSVVCVLGAVLMTLWYTGVLFGRDSAETRDSGDVSVDEEPEENWGLFKEVQVIQDDATAGECSVQLSSDGKRLMITNGTGVSTFKLEDGQYSHMVTNRESGSIHDAAMNTDGSHVAYVKPSGTVMWWHGSSEDPFEVEHELRSDQYRFSNIQFSDECGEKLYVRGVNEYGQGRLFLYDMGHVVWTLDHPESKEGDAFGISFQVADNKMIVASPVDKSAYVYTLSDEEPPQLTERIQPNSDHSMYPFQVGWSRTVPILTDPTCTVDGKLSAGALTVLTGGKERYVVRPDSTMGEHFGSHLSTHDTFVHAASAKPSDSTWIYMRTGGSLTPHTRIECQTSSPASFANVDKERVRFAIGDGGNVRIYESVRV